VTTRSQRAGLAEKEITISSELDAEAAREREGKGEKDVRGQNVVWNWESWTETKYVGGFGDQMMTQGRVVI